MPAIFRCFSCETLRLSSQRCWPRRTKAAVLGHRKTNNKDSRARPRGLWLNVEKEDYSSMTPFQRVS